MRLPILVLLATLTAACTPKAACPVIRLAADACPLVVEYLDASGHVQRVTLTPDEARALAAGVAGTRTGVGPR